MRSLYVNLPVQDVAASRAFFTGLGFGVDEQWSDASATCVVVEENVRVMLLATERFADFVNGPVSDAHSTTEVLLCLSAGSREEVDDLADRAIAAGAKPWKPAIETGAMYGRSFQDPDGHVWELMHLPQG